MGNMILNTEIPPTRVRTTGWFELSHWLTFEASQAIGWLDCSVSGSGSGWCRGWHENGKILHARRFMSIRTLFDIITFEGRSTRSTLKDDNCVQSLGEILSPICRPISTFFTCLLRRNFFRQIWNERPEISTNPKLKEKTNTHLVVTEFYDRGIF